MAYGNSNGGSGAGAGKSAQYNDEQKAKALALKIKNEELSSKPRAYGGQPSSGIGAGSGAKPLPKNISVFSNSSGVGSGSGGGVPIINGPKPIPPAPTPPVPTQPITSSARPKDPSEIAVENAPSISNLTKQVFDKNKFKETIDTSFSQLGDQNPIDEGFFDINLATIGDFFTLYDQFFYDIPKEGDTNSHTYLAQSSGEYANFELIQEEIQALLDEIGEIRLENVELRTSQSLLEVDLASANATIIATQIRQV